MLILLQSKPTLAAIINSWALPSATSKHEAALQTLIRLQVLSPTPSPNAPEPAYSLTKSFSHHIRNALCSGLAVNINKVPDHVTAATPSRSAVDQLADNQWEHLLLFTVGGDEEPPVARELQPSIPLHLLELLLAAGLVAVNSTDGSRTVTQTGFQFLLSDTYSQLWLLLREYIARAEGQSSIELASVLGFLLQLGFQGELPLQCASLSPLQRDIAAHMVQLGVLAAFKVDREVWLRPTRLAVLMASGSDINAATHCTDGFVIVETNARVYAYTSSPVRQAILRLFVRCDVLLPNLFVGTITRESAVSALESGVSAEQIIGYLRQHAHPRVANKVPIVPGVVADQIRLWQRDLKRLGHHTGVLYKNFEGDELYRRVAAFAEQKGYVLARDNARREFVAKADGHPFIRDKIKEVKHVLGY